VRELVAPKKRMIAVVCVALALSGVAVVIIAGSSGAASKPSPSRTFSVLQPASEDALNAMSPEAREWVASRSGLVQEQATPREVGVAHTSTGDEVAVVGDENTVCLFNVSSKDSNCGPVGLAASGAMFTASPDGDGCSGWKVMGVMPDNVASLTVHAAEGAGDPPTIAVSSNVYTATLAPVHTTLSSGDIEVELPLDKFGAGSSAC
jgi:hypothetical protein